MRHLYNTRAAVYRLSGPVQDGTPVLSWHKLTDILDDYLGVPGELMCRLDTLFMRPGKDAPMPAMAGRAPDSVGVMFFDPTPFINAGDRVTTLSGPVPGTYELRTIPDPAIAMADTHHLEVQVIEVSQSLAGQYPSAEPVG